MEFKIGDILIYKADNSEYFVIENEEINNCVAVKCMKFSSVHRVPKEWFYKKITKRNHLPKWLQDNTRR